MLMTKALDVKVAPASANARVPAPTTTQFRRVAAVSHLVGHKNKAGRQAAVRALQFEILLELAWDCTRQIISLIAGSR